MQDVVHADFTIERTYPASPERVFSAFADPKKKARWAQCHDAWAGAWDFRIGGRETGRGGPPGGPVFEVETTYRDIVEGRRIVYSYDMKADGERISVSVVTVQFEPAGAGTRLTFTEQACFLDGRDRPEHREHGTAHALDRIPEALALETA